MGCITEYGEALQEKPFLHGLKLKSPEDWLYNVRAQCKINMQKAMLKFQSFHTESMACTSKERIIFVIEFSLVEWL